jgi:thiosulfate dehydrogenase [quinone] large subunit
MTEKTIIDKRGQILIQDPPIAFALFQTTRFAWLWLIIRVYLGYSWLTSGWGKITNPAWQTGGPLRGFWENAVTIPESGRPAIAFDWYRNFIQFMLDNQWYEWFADLVMYGELLVGITLILGAFTGIAAFAGSFMNWNFIMAGAASTNGLMLTLSVILILAWKVAGWYGLDRWLLTLLGTPWSRSGETGSPGLMQPAGD